MTKIEFVSYDGKYPHYCRGTLVLRIDGKEVSFTNVLTSGGYCHWDGTIDFGPWMVNTFQMEKMGLDLETAIEIEDLVNENVPRGCCGGCFDEEES